MENPVRRFAPCVLAAAAVVTGVAVAPAASAGTAPLDYVALGDSYSAASGVLPPDPSAAPQCLRSTRNYPHDIAAATGATLTDVTCGGADTGDYAGSQYQGVPPQLDALHPGTQLVTMTIGGNDSNVFISSILECGALGATTLGQGSPCKGPHGPPLQGTIHDTHHP